VANPYLDDRSHRNTLLLNSFQILHNCKIFTFTSAITTATALTTNNNNANVVLHSKIFFMFTYFSGVAMHHLPDHKIRHRIQYIKNNYVYVNAVNIFY
jgi:hypothetical protein